MGICSSRPATATQPLRQETPQQVQNEIVERTPIFPQLLTAAPLQYILRKVSQGICRENFLRWGMKNPQNNRQFLYDPTQRLNFKVAEVVQTTGLIPSIFYQDGDTFSLIERNIAPGVNRQNFPKTQIQRAVDFIKRHRVVYIAYNTEQRDENGNLIAPVSHAILFKRINRDDPRIMEVIESNGLSYFDLVLSDRMPMTYRSLAFITKIIKDAQITIDDTPRCKFQTERGTCGLWATLGAIYVDKSTAELKAMIDRAIRDIGLPMKNDTEAAVESYDMFIMELFYEFIQRPVLATDVPADYREGFGKPKCKKCGLPKR